jgi:hypothetical protein
MRQNARFLVVPRSLVVASSEIRWLAKTGSGHIPETVQARDIFVLVLRGHRLRRERHLGPGQKTVFSASF